MNCNIIASASVNGGHIVIVKVKVYVNRTWGVREKYCTMLTPSPERATSLVRKDILTSRNQAFNRYRKMLKVINHLTIRNHEDKQS
jgi:hypothetical protein